MNIAMGLTWPVATILTVDITTKMNICFITHENVVKVVVIHSFQQKLKIFQFTLSSLFMLEP